MSERQAITGRMARIYDVFVDWEDRLRREMPALTRRLADVGARRVLDVGCGTGRHVQALLERGFDAYGADPSEDMLSQARELIGEPGRLLRWRLGEEPTGELRAASPFDAVIALGNVWPHVLLREEVESSCAAFRALVRPGGLVLLGLKAVAVRKESGNPYMPLLRREREGRPYYFVRFVDFAVAPLPDGSPVCELHMTVVSGDAEQVAELEDAGAILHRASRMRVWSPDELERTFTGLGFADVHASARLDDPSAPATTEDVFLHALVPASR